MAWFYMYMTLFACMYENEGLLGDCGPTIPFRSMAILSNTSKSNINHYIACVFPLNGDGVAWIGQPTRKKTNMRTWAHICKPTSKVMKNHPTRGGGPTCHRRSADLPQWPHLSQVSECPTSTKGGGHFQDRATTQGNEQQ